MRDLVECMADAKAELEALQKEHEEKQKLLIEKRKFAEDLRKRRVQRLGQQDAAAKAAGGDKVGGDKNKTVDALVAELLRGGSIETAALQMVARGPQQPSGTAADVARRKQLQSENQVAVVSWQPQEQEVYERSVQTDMSGEDALKSQEGDKKNPAKLALNLGKNLLAQVQQQADKAKKRAVKPEGAEENKGGLRMIRVQTQAGQEEKEDDAEDIKEMSQEERDRVTSQSDFKSFFSRATLLVERTLGAQEWDVADDWGTRGANDNSAAEASELMHHVHDFTEDKWSKQRPVTDVKFSPHKKEHFMAAYGERVGASMTDPDGCLLIWNLAMKNRPELCFTSPSPVLTANFQNFDESLFYGGTYSGGIVLWDAKARRGPVLRTPLSAKGHLHPVTAMQQVGTQNATNLVTASNDGRLCVWSMAMMNAPIETIDLKNETRSRGNISIMSLSFPENETNVLYVGAEDGLVCQVNLRGSKVNVTEVYDGHDGPVSGVHVHPRQVDPNQGGEAFTVDIAVSCSFDWSIKLWMVKSFQQPVLQLDTSEDYVYDVKWHPQHPGVLASINGEGLVDLWNLNQNIESPVVRCENPNQRKLALNRCGWSGDGRRLAAGDSDGTVSVYGVDQSIFHPRTADFVQFNERVRSFTPIVQRPRDGAYGDMRFPGMRTGLEIGRH